MFAKHLGKEVHRILLTFIVPHLGNQQLALMPEVIVVAHLAGEESICSLSNGVRQQEATCTTTQSHTAYLAATKLVMTYALNAKQHLHTMEKILLVLCHG